MKILRKLALLPMIALLLPFGGCNAPALAEGYSQTREGLLGTVITLTIYRRDEALLDSVFDRIQEIDDRMSRTKVESEISLLNQASGVGAVALSPETVALVREASRISALSGGALDITVGPLSTLWDISGTPRVPEYYEIDMVMGLVDYTKLIWDEAEGFAYLEEQGMEADLGAIAKGYACDEAVRIFREAGIGTALLELGGNIYALGHKPDGSLWKIGVSSPIPGERGAHIGILSVSDSAVVTSGSYERYFEKNGKFYHHILDPHTGYPADSGLLSVTIACGDSTVADALSTACFVLGLEEGMALAQGQGVEAIFVTSDMEVYLTDGIRDGFSLNDSRFKLMA